MGAIRFAGDGAAQGPLTDADVAAIAAAFRPRLDPYLIWAIVDVEAPGGGYLPDGRLKTLFEAHLFDRLTGGAHRAAHPTLSSPRWDRSLYWGGAAEYVRLGRAMRLDEAAALGAASWGAGQILGLNCAKAGYASARLMIEDFADHSGAQIVAVLRFLRAIRALTALREHRFEAVARAYNGPRYRETRHHLKLGVAAAARAGLVWLHLGAAGDDVAELQMALRDAGVAIEIDGAFGPKSAAALLAWQATFRKPHPLS